MFHEPAGKVVVVIAFDIRYHIVVLLVKIISLFTRSKNSARVGFDSYSLRRRGRSQHKKQGKQMPTTSTGHMENVQPGSDFAKDVRNRSGVNFNACYHCQSCSNGCPFADAMDYLPNRIIRLVQLGQKEAVLQCASIWVCVGCNTCSIQCPNSIDISALTHVLCQIAVEERSPVAEPDILKFHREVLNTIQRYGRTHKLEIMMRYKFHKQDWFSDMKVGFKMVAKRKLELLPSRVAHIKEIKDFFKERQTG